MKFFRFFNKESKPKKYKKNPKISLGLALGGGATRGIAHIGVLRAFEKLGIDFDIVAGTSAGSIIGALYSYGLDSYDLERLVLTLNAKDIRGSRPLFMAAPMDRLEQTISGIIGENRVFSELKKPFTAVAVNIFSGKEVWIESGSVAKACCASASVPAVFTPVLWQDKLLIDGGMRNVVPADVCRKKGADVVVAVDVNSQRASGAVGSGTLKVLNACLGILIESNAKESLKQADVIIEPDVKRFRGTKLASVAEMIAEGERSVLDRSDEIIGLISKKSHKKVKKWRTKDLEYI